MALRDANGRFVSGGGSGGSGSGSSVKWHGDEFERELDKLIVQRLERAAILVQNKAKELISIGSNKGKTPSAPGEPPHKDTGRLRASVSREVDAKAQTARVGTNLKVGKWLQLGTKKMAARPWLDKALELMWHEVQSILKGK